MQFLFIIVLAWGVAIGAWFLVSRYFGTVDSQKIRDRLMGTTRKAQKKATAAATPQSVMHTQDLSPNKLAQMLVDKYKLGPKINDYLEQAGLRWAPARLVHLCLLSFAGGLVVSYLMLPLPHVFDLLAG